MSNHPVFSLLQFNQKPDIRRIQFDNLFRQYKKLVAEKNFAKALEAARAAHKLSPSPAIAHSQALCLHRLGRSEEAYQLARKFQPKEADGTYFDLMADICGALGRSDDVRKWVRLPLLNMTGALQTSLAFRCPTIPRRRMYAPASSPTRCSATRRVIAKSPS